MKMSNACVIILQGGTRNEREGVHEVIKEHANGWWHNFVDVWVAGGQASSFWSNVIVPELENGHAKLLVLDLPSNLNERSYGGFMANDEAEWLDDEYLERPRTPKILEYAPEDVEWDAGSLEYAPDDEAWDARSPEYPPEDSGW